MTLPSSFLPPGKSGGRDVIGYGIVDIAELNPPERWAVPQLDRKALYLATKRLMDIAAAGGGLLFLSPLFFIVALLVKLTDGGPVFFSQKRVGKDGRLFDFFKFRSMVMHADQIKEQLLAENDHADSRTFKMRNDPRITRVGRFLRRASIDELPQLWNVLLGDMSLVGPRPPVPSEVALYSENDHRRLSVRPGLTCLWQIRGRSQLPFERQVELDLEYIDSQSLLIDLQILAGTIPAVYYGHGAY